MQQTLQTALENVNYVIYHKKHKVKKILKTSVKTLFKIKIAIKQNFPKNDLKSFEYL